MQVPTKCKKFHRIHFSLCVSTIAAIRGHAIYLIILVWANKGFSLLAIDYHIECVSRIKILEILSQAIWLALYSVERKISFRVVMWTKQSLEFKGSLRKTSWKKMKSLKKKNALKKWNLLMCYVTSYVCVFLSYSWDSPRVPEETSCVWMRHP